MTLSRIHSVIPPDECGCLWMAAGVLHYRLCDREYNCDECPLDAALRRHVRPGPPPAGSSGAQRPSVSGPALRKDCLYSRNHCWALSIDTPDAFRVGIEPGLARVIGRAKTVLLPSPGQTIQPGQTCAWIVNMGGTLPLEAPVGGSVRAANPLLADSPHLLLQDPFDYGWLYEVTGTREAGDADLFSAERIAAAYAADHARFLAALPEVSGADEPDAGYTFADLEERLESIMDFVGPKRYLNVVRQVYA